jgi:hypothetical protein
VPLKPALRNLLKVIGNLLHYDINLYESEDEQLKICFSYGSVSQDYRLSNGDQDYIKNYLKRTIIAIHIEKS